MVLGFEFRTYGEWFRPQTVRDQLISKTDLIGEYNCAGEEVNSGTPRVRVRSRGITAINSWGSGRVRSKGQIEPTSNTFRVDQGRISLVGSIGHSYEVKSERRESVIGYNE